jgi:hypothetical protein
MTGSILLAAVSLLGAVDAKGPGIEQQAAIMESLRPALVKVQYTLQYDKGQPPVGAGWSKRCPNCGQYHAGDTSGVVSDERPFETPGFLIADRRVVAPDILIHPRFVKSINVRFGDASSSARVGAYGRQQRSVFLELSEPLPGARPLSFVDQSSPPYLAVTYTQENGTWALGIQPMTPRVTIAEAGWKYIAAPDNCLITDGQGRPAGLCMCEQLPLDDTWKCSPERWPVVSAAMLEQQLAGLGKAAEGGLRRVSLQFRSPKTTPQNRWSYRHYSEEAEDGSGTNLEVIGLLLDDRRVLVLANLPPKRTARLERILVHPGGGARPQAGSAIGSAWQTLVHAGEPVPARFECSLADFGCLLAVLDKPLPGATRLSDRSILDFRNDFLLGVDLAMQGEQRTAYYQHARIASFELGFRGQPYPQLAMGAGNMFLYEEGGALLAVPVTRRKKVTVREEWDYSQAALTPVSYLTTLLKDPATNADPNNVPLTEEQENRLAWMGVELQGLDQNLARLNKVADLTNDGQSGALVTYVYPDSPAALAGIEVGDVLLRLHVEGHPKPLEIKVENDRMGMSEFPWEQLEAGGIPAEYLSQLPTPWPSAENSFTRALTELGFGTKYQAEFWHDGKLITKAFTAVESPPHFDSAPRYKSDPLGVTVRDQTYEVRRHFGVAADEAGVVIAKVEPGSKAAVAGVLPYERITHVNDQTVASVAEFEKLIAVGGEVRLSMKRQSKGRLVKIKLPAAKQAKQEAGATQPAL